VLDELANRAAELATDKIVGLLADLLFPGGGVLLILGMVGGIATPRAYRWAVIGFAAMLTSIIMRYMF